MPAQDPPAQDSLAHDLLAHDLLAHDLLAGDLLARDLREANQRLVGRLQALSRAPALIPPEQMAGLLSELLRFAELRERLPDETQRTSQLQAELALYRRSVESLREVLPAIYTRLLAERSRIEAERSRLRAADEWARTSRQTL